jgi:hypothetical protein
MIPPYQYLMQLPQAPRSPKKEMGFLRKPMPDILSRTLSLEHVPFVPSEPVALCFSHLLHRIVIVSCCQGTVLSDATGWMWLFRLKQ